MTRRLLAVLSGLVLLVPRVSAGVNVNSDDRDGTHVLPKGGGTVGLAASATGFTFDPDNDGLPEAVMNADGTMNVSGIFVGGDYSNIAFEPHEGKLTFCAFGQDNNECSTLDYESTANRVIETSTTGLTEKEVSGILVSTGLTIGTSSYDIISGLVAEYRMEENAANTTVANYYSGSVLNCTASTNTNNLSITGKLNNGFNFSSGSSESLDCGSNSALKFPNDFTFAAWIRNTTVSDRLAGNRSSSGNNDGWEALITSGGFVELLVDPGTGTAQNIIGTTLVNNAKWHHLATGRKGDVLFLYVDSLSEGVITGDVPQTIANQGNTQIGRSPNSSAFYEGDMDHVQFYNRALTTNEVKQLYNNNIGTLAYSATFPPNNIYVDGGVGSYGIKVGGTTGGCLMFNDTDNAGFTECVALNGTLSCTVDADGVCDGS